MEMPDVTAVASDPGLLQALERAKRLGFTGPGDTADHILHALRFVPVALEAFSSTGIGRGVDLGSGAGLPGLVLAVAFPLTTWVLVDSMERRTSALEQAVRNLDLGDRVQVLLGRAESVARDPAHRNAAALVTARSFGPPAAAAECGAPLLLPQGLLAVSEPPGSSGERWPAAPLTELGLEPMGVRDGIMVCRSTHPTPDSYPRKVGIPSKRPLF